MASSDSEHSSIESFEKEGEGEDEDYENFTTHIVILIFT